MINNINFSGNVVVGNRLKTEITRNPNMPPLEEFEAFADKLSRATGQNKGDLMLLPLPDSHQKHAIINARHPPAPSITA